MDARYDEGPCPSHAMAAPGRWEHRPFGITLRAVGSDVRPHSQRHFPFRSGRFCRSSCTDETAGATLTECCGGNIDRQRVLRIAVMLAVRKKPLGAVESAGAWRRRPTLT